MHQKFFIDGKTKGPRFTLMLKMTHAPTRRSFLLGLLAVPAASRAHEGHDASHITATADILKAKGQRLHLVVTLFNASTTVETLESASVLGATVMPFDALEVPSGSLTDLRLTVDFVIGVPGIFTMVLDFGDAGQGPIVITP